MEKHFKDILNTIEQQPQSQISLQEQLFVIKVFANRLGLYDGTDFIIKISHDKS